MAADKETIERFLNWLHGNDGQRPDLPEIQKRIADDGIDIHAPFTWDCNLKSKPYAEDHYVKVKGNLLHYAVGDANPELLRWLITKGVDVNAPLTNTGRLGGADATIFQLPTFPAPIYTPLALAAHNLVNDPENVPEIVNILLAAGADPNLAVDKDEKNTAISACVRSFLDRDKSDGTWHYGRKESKYVLEALLRAGADPALAMDDLLGELHVRKKEYENPVAKKKRVETKGRFEPHICVNHRSIEYCIKLGELRLRVFTEALNMVLQHHFEQLLSRQQGRRLFDGGDEAVAGLAQACDATGALKLAAMVREGSKPAPDFPAFVEHCLNAGMAEIAVSLFAPDKWPDKPDLLHAYDETLSHLQPEHAAFLQNRIDMTPIRREHTGRHGESWLARYSTGLQEQTPMAEPQR